MNLLEHKKNSLKLFEPIFIGIFWILLFASPFYLGEDDWEWSDVFRIWKMFVPYLVLFLINRFVLLPYLFFRHHRFIFMASIVILILFMSYVVHIISANGAKKEGLTDHPRALNEMPMNRDDESVGPWNKPGPPRGENRPPREMMRMDKPPGPPLKQLPPFVSFSIISVLIIGFDTGLKLSVKWVQSEQRRISAEKENVENQLAFLKNQISPHFFMNTLNNIHSLIEINKEEARESIIKLSKLMRHLLYESEAKEIPVQKEFDFILNYVEIMKLRFSEKVQINLDISSESCDKKIPPLLFTSFVENAFKYGVSYKKESFIDIAFTCQRDYLLFEISNSFQESMEQTESGGIGIENARKRLNLLYGDQYSLIIDKSADVFNVKLKIPV